MTATFENLSPNLDYGALVRGLRESDLEDAALRDKLQRLWLDRGLVVFRECAPTPAFQVELTRCFGEPERHAHREIWVGGHPELTQIKSGENDGILWEVDGKVSPSWIPWHSDQIYVPRINHGGILRAVTLPGEGGRTGFIDRISSYERLPDALKDSIDGLRVIYKMRIDISKNPFATRQNVKLVSRSAYFRSMEEREDRDFPPVTHPLVYRQPDTGRKVLNLSPLFAVGIENMGEAEAAELLQRLVDHLTDDDHAYYHRWTKSDMILWDNWRMVHSVTASPLGVVREMHRTNIAGDYALGAKLEAA